MAFVPSVGDVLTALQLVVDVYQKTVNAPGELQAAVKDVRAMKAELESMKNKVGDKNSFVQKNGEAMLATITDTFEPLKEDLRNMKRLVGEFNKIPPFSPQKMIFGVFKIPDVKKIQENFTKYRAIYSRAFEHFGAVADAHNAAELKAINDKLEIKNKQLARDITALKKQQQAAAKAQEANNAKMDKALKLLENMKAPAAPGSPSQTTSKADLVKQLLDSGLKTEDVKTIMGPMIFASQEPQLGIPKIEVGPPGARKDDFGGSGHLQRIKSQGAFNGPKVLEPALKIPGRSLSVSRPKDKPTINPTPSSPKPLAARLPKNGGSESATSRPKTPTNSNKDLNTTSPVLNRGTGRLSQLNQREKDREKIKILCVDRTGGVHSTLAQTYLELLRLWTANTSDPKSATINWLFSRVATRDISIATTLTTHPSLSPPVTDFAPKPPPKSNIISHLSPMKAINAMTEPEHYFRSIDRPHEKAILVSRIDAQLIYPRGIKNHDFDWNDYILCFDSSVEKDLYRLKAITRGEDIPANSKVNPKPARSPSPPDNTKGAIICLPSTSWYIPGKHNSAPELEEFISNMRASLKYFASKYLGWERPHHRFENGALRTIQLTLPFEDRETIMAAVGRGVDDVRKAQLSGIKDIEGEWVGLLIERGKKEERQLVCVTVPKEKARAAEGWIRGLLAKKK